MLLKAVYSNDIEAVKKALLNKEDINIQGYNGNTALTLVSGYGYSEVVKLLLENPEKTKMDVNIQNHQGDTALILSYRYGYIEIVKLLLENPEKTNINVNIQDYEKLTPLDWATMNNYPEIVKLLINAKADVNIINGYIGTALLYACYYGHKEIVKILLKHRKIKLYDILQYTQIKEILRRNADIQLKFLRQPKKEVKYYDKRF